ncbi:MAG: hypothetical protein WBW33_15850, partial [Bryobacteraceae bacterium]
DTVSERPATYNGALGLLCRMNIRTSEQLETRLLPFHPEPRLGGRRDRRHEGVQNLRRSTAHEKKETLALKTIAEITKWMTVNSEAIYSTRPSKIFGAGPSMQHRRRRWNGRNAGAFQ